MSPVFLQIGETFYPTSHLQFQLVKDGVIVFLVDDPYSIARYQGEAASRLREWLQRISFDAGPEEEEEEQA